MRSPRRGIAAALALLFLATTAAMVVSVGGGSVRPERARLLDLHEARARYAAEAGRALAVSAARAGLSPENIVFDPSLPVITVEETVEVTGPVWIARGLDGPAVRERSYSPQGSP